MTLRVFETVPARPVTAGWVAQAVGPAVAACRFRADPPPLEFAALNRRVGGKADRLAAGDGRVQIARAAITFWSSSGLVSTYIHEVAHRLCFADSIDEAHGPVFFGVLAALAARVDAAQGSDSLTAQTERLSLYDCQTQPTELKELTRPQWSSLVVRFGLQCGVDLANAETAAEDLPREVARCWAAFTKKLVDEERVLEDLRAKVLAVRVESRRLVAGARVDSRLLKSAEAHPVAAAAMLAGVPSVLWMLTTIFLTLR